MKSRYPFDRRSMLGMMAFGAAAWTTPGAFAEELSLTPKNPLGPFYPDKLPLDTDNDLIIVNDSTTPGVGTISHLGGRVLDASGSPIRNAMIEIWQCDSNGVYHHSKGAPKGRKRETNFQCYGRFLTGSKGSYSFRTIKPVAYPGRTPHIHVIVSHGGKRVLTTQLYVKGEEKRNEKDGLYKRVDEKDRHLLEADFQPIKDSKIGELAASWDIVVGRTPADKK
jgi:protocatechuate 3,4-dioxygenase beta subunit